MTGYHLNMLGLQLWVAGAWCHHSTCLQHCEEKIGQRCVSGRCAPWQEAVDDRVHLNRAGLQVEIAGGQRNLWSVLAHQQLHITPQQAAQLPTCVHTCLALLQVS